MLNYKRYLALLLTIATTINLLPAQALSETLSEVPPSVSEPAPEEENQESEPPAEGESSGESETPTDPENSGESETPAEPENPGESETPAEPENPDESETPTVPTVPSVPGDPGASAEPGIPSDPGVLGDSGTPAQEENASSGSSWNFRDEITDEAQLAFLVYLEGQGASFVKVGETVTMTVSDSNANNIFTYLSRKNASWYQNWTIYFGFTGGITLPSEYVGLGSEASPFRGTFAGNNIYFESSRPIFNVLSSTASFQTENSIIWKGAVTTPILAKTLCVESSQNFDIRMPVQISNAEGYAQSFSPYIGTLLKKCEEEAGTILLPKLDYSNASSAPDSVDKVNCMGLVCQEMEQGTKLQIGKIILPSAEITYHADHAGGLVGLMGKDSQLTISSDLYLITNLRGTDTGGLVGTMDSGAIIQFSEGAGVSIHTTQKNTENAGGIAGVATTSGDILKTAVSPTPANPGTSSTSGINKPGELNTIPSTGAGSGASTSEEYSVSADTTPSLDEDSDVSESETYRLSADTTPASGSDDEPNVLQSEEHTPGLFSRILSAVVRFFAAPFRLSRAVDSAEDTPVLLADDTTSTLPDISKDELENVYLKSVKLAASSNAGTLYGQCTVTGSFNPLSGVQFNQQDSAGNYRQPAGKGSCGGLFGTLILSGNGTCTISGSEESPVQINSILKENTDNNTIYGGVAGTLYGSSRAHALVIKYANIQSSTEALSGGAANRNAFPSYLGGVVGKQLRTLNTSDDGATVDISDCTINVISPKLSNIDKSAFGGLSAYVDSRALLMAENVTIKSAPYDLNPRGGSVAGSTNAGSIVYLSGKIDLSDCVLTSNAYSGQIVGIQESSLIYAPDAQINRYSKGLTLDDIGNYGELYRIQNFLTVDKEKDYKTDFPHTLTLTDSKLSFSDDPEVSPLDYACLALAWQSRGNFPTVTGVTTDNWKSKLKTCTIELNSNVDMTGKGIGGLTRDKTDYENNAFSGMLEGNGHTITLDIGATNSFNTVTNGDGRIYRHSDTGLFATLYPGATIRNLKLSGSIRIDNTSFTSDMRCGSLAAHLNGSNSDGYVTLANVSTNVKFDTNANVGTSGTSALYVGGLFGLVSNTNGLILNLGTQPPPPTPPEASPSTEADQTGTAVDPSAQIEPDVMSEPGVMLSDPGVMEEPESTPSAPESSSGESVYGVKLSPTIEIFSGNGSRSHNHFGSAIGGIGSDAKSLTINCPDLTISGSINYDGVLDNIYAGGLIGTIFPVNDQKIRTINLEKVTVDRFKLSGEASERMSGILGGIWLDTDVNLKNLSVSKTTLEANGTAPVGGLVYRASGKWTVDTIDLANLTINASSATALGLLVCQGGSYQELLNGSLRAVGGLYLEMIKPWESIWESSYIVPADDKITLNSVAVFDEFVAYTAYRSTTSSTYDITHNGSGIISLKTTDPICMTEGSAGRNTYENRTDVGSIRKTNGYSRYYYNLTTLDTAPAQISTPQELLNWSACVYAASNLQSYFTSDTSSLQDVSTLGGTADARADFDLKGYSYYPVSLINRSVTIKYADVTFYNQNIEDKEFLSEDSDDNNKSTRSATQHYAMHFGLFFDFIAENISSSIDRTMTVNGVSFAGTVGMDLNVSGALVCGRIEGQQNGGTVSRCKVDIKDDGVSLSGIQVYNKNTPVLITPVLINRAVTLCDIKASRIVATDEQKGTVAGSSLIGDVGQENANVTVAFSGTIRLPEAKSGEEQVFSKATLLNSLRYTTGSATYVFTKDKDYQDNSYVHHAATHGYELSESYEFIGKCGHYDSSDEYVSDNGKFTEKNSFSDILPYVFNSPATKLTDKEKAEALSQGYHELAVNIKFEHLLDGCGTYGHPYRVTAAQFKDAAAYINSSSGAAASGWKIQMPKSGDYHNTYSIESDVEVTYVNGAWTGSDGKVYNNVQDHLRSAYYQLVPDQNGEFTLENFSGIGEQETLPFTGVITGKGSGENTTVTLINSHFIKYSYGSVVRDLTIEVNSAPALNRVNAVDEGVKGVAQPAPKTFFGGVMGCVLGGDNIIENVNVTVTDSAVTTSGDKPHLVPVGGHIGVIAGGGVLFRGSIESSFSPNQNLYQNPVIGRVLGGYAFYEDEDPKSFPNNGDKNYKINQIFPSTDDLSWKEDSGASTLTVNSAQGLLLLSGILSSGAGDSATSNAYANTYAKARHAKYDAIGKDKDTAQEDYGTASADNSSKVPYLWEYANSSSETIKICNLESNKGIHLKFAKDFDMDGYGNGYRGLSARYVSNAAYNKNSVVTPACVVLRVRTFDGQNTTGQNTTVKNISMEVKEYNNDDFHAASMGGIFNILWTEPKTGGAQQTAKAEKIENGIFAKDLTLQDCKVVLQYVDSDGNNTPQADFDTDNPGKSTLTDQDGRSCVSVGGLIGSVSDLVSVSISSPDRNYLLYNLRIEGSSPSKTSKIQGPNGAGGLIGTSAMAPVGTGYPGILLANGSNSAFAPHFWNCSYENITVIGGLAAGGLIGCAFALNSKTPAYDTLGTTNDNDNDGCFVTCTVTDSDLVTGSNSTIQTTAKGSLASGVFGAVGMRILVNDSSIQSKTKIAAFPASDNLNLQMLELNQVTIQANSENADIHKTTPTKASNKEYYQNGLNPTSPQSSASGVISRISHVNPSYIQQVKVKDCKISTPKSSTSSDYSGGIVGIGYINTRLNLSQCEVIGSGIGGDQSNPVFYSTIESKYAGGLVAQGKDSGFVMNMRDCKVENTKISGTSNAGGLVGEAKKFYNLFNILIKNVSIEKNGKTDGCGQLFGTTNDTTVNAVGISVFADDSRVKVPSNICGSGSVTTNSYVVYADYSGKEISHPDSNAPYVTYSPHYSLPGTDKVLTGDAVGWDGPENVNNRTSIGARIYNDADKDNTSSQLNLATYPTGRTVDMSGLISNFWTVQNLEKPTGWKDLPVLVLKDANADVITQYLNMMTNGGYDSVQNNSDVFFFSKPCSYVYDPESKTFRKEDESSIGLYSGKPRIKPNAFDNTLNRFTLVEATFRVTVNNERCEYRVSIPVIVVRELQCNFIATFAYGTEFQASTFTNLENHVLDSTGSPFTGYLTYEYNRNKNEYKSYDWQSYMENGGSMLNMDNGDNMSRMDKQLDFFNGLPKETQLTLLDCQNGNQAYTLTTTDDRTNSVTLSSFTSVSDSNIKLEVSLAEILGVYEVPNPTEGVFVITDKDDKPTVRLKSAEGKYVYYRPYNSDTDSGEKRCNLQIPKYDEQNPPPAENYYLVITIPTQSDSDYYLQGRLTSSLVWEMPYSMTAVHRKDKSDYKIGNNDETTYQISSGYGQSLVSEDSDSGYPVNLNGTEKHMSIAVKNTITFSNRQSYGKEDALYLQLTATPYQHTRPENSDAAVAQQVQFPAGTSAKVTFYVQGKENCAGESKYWVFHPDTGAWSSTSVETPVVRNADGYTYLWTSVGDNMKLLLSKDGVNPLDLSKVREKVNGNQKDGYGELIVRAVVQTVDFQTEDDLKQVVPASEYGTDAWAQLHYVAQVSTQIATLDYSSARQTPSPESKFNQYYLAVSYKAILSMDADYVDQLGINPLALVPEYLNDDRTASRIALTATLDLKNLPHYEKKLQSLDELTFSLSLQRRDEDLYRAVSADDSDDYISFAWPTATEQNTLSWVVSKGVDGQPDFWPYFDSNKARFTIPLTAYVSLAPRDFANYKIVLTVKELGADILDDTDAYVIYTYACINPKFYAPRSDT